MIRRGRGSSARKIKQTLSYRKFRSLVGWTCEEAEDCEAQFGLDLIDELTKSLIAEIL